MLIIFLFLKRVKNFFQHLSLNSFRFHQNLCIFLIKTRLLKIIFSILRMSTIWFSIFIRKMYSRLIKSIHLVVIWFHIDFWDFILIQQMWSSFLKFHTNLSNVLFFVFDFHYRTFIFCFNDVSRARYWQFLWYCCFRAHWNDRRVINTRKFEIKLKSSTNRSN